MGFYIDITLEEVHNDPFADEPFDLAMTASLPREPGGRRASHVVVLNCPFGAVLPEVASFLDRNVR